MFFADYHIHTRNSADSDADPALIIKQAEKLGLSEICFCDHAELNILDSWYYSSDDCYRDYILSSKDAKIPVKIGVEIGQQTEFPELSKKILAFPHYDFVIGSYHCMKGYPDFYYLDFSDYDVRKLYDNYFEGLLEYVTKADFDILGHISYPFRYGIKNGFPDITIENYRSEVDEVLKMLVSRGKGLEVNTSGIRDTIADTLPPIWVHKRFLELGGENITVGSDAHLPEHVGFAVKETVEKLKAVGFKAITSYSERKPIYNDI